MQSNRIFEDTKQSKLLKTKVKAARISNLTDARYFAAREADWMSFSLSEGSEGYISPIEVKAIKEWVEGPVVIGHFGLETPDDIRKMTEILDLQCIQLSFACPVETSEALKDLNPIKEIVVSEETSDVELQNNLKQFAPYTDMFVLDFSKNNISYEALNTRSTGVNADFVKELCAKYKVVLDLPFKADATEDILDAFMPYGIQLAGGEEERVGVKSFEELDDILDELEVWD